MKHDAEVLYADAYHGEKYICNFDISFSKRPCSTRVDNHIVTVGNIVKFENTDLSLMTRLLKAGAI